MTEKTDRSALLDLELMAYADGLLEDAPLQKARIERRLADAPEAAAAVAAIRTQNAALRRRYGAADAEPVPERLYAVLDRAPTGRRGVAYRTAAVVAMVATAAAAGWWTGRLLPADPWPSPSLLESGLLADLDMPRVEAANGGTRTTTTPAALNALLGRNSLSLRAPDLGDDGYILVAKETVQIAGEQVVRLRYASEDGSGINLLLQPRWERRNPQIRQVRRDGVRIAYWRDGPLSSMLAARMKEEDLVALAEKVRKALRDRQMGSPGVRAKVPAAGLPGLAADGDVSATPPIP